jgi:hypothetical protein
LRLSGEGSGEVRRDGSAWDLDVTGTNASSTLTISTDDGGDRRVVLDDVRVMDLLGHFLASNATLSGTLAARGAVGTVALSGLEGGMVAAPSIATVALGSARNATFLIGADLGADGERGGSGADADSFGTGSIGIFGVLGSVLHSAVRVGQDPVAGIFDDCDDVIHGGLESHISTIRIGGELSADSRIVAGRLPEEAFVDGALIATAGDPRFATVVGGAHVEFGLADDTGDSNTDRLTSNPTITGVVTVAEGLSSLRAAIDGGNAGDILGDLGPDGSFVLARTRLEEILGGPLLDGAHVLTVESVDVHGGSCVHTLSFVLDTQAPALGFDLAALSDTPPLGDQRTLHPVVNLRGSTDALRVVRLFDVANAPIASAVSDASGAFQFGDIALALGDNAFSAAVADAAGNLAGAARTIVRVAAPVLDPIGNRSVNEGENLAFQTRAIDPDAGPEPLTFSVTGPLPPGANLDAQGLFTWTPGESEGPGRFSVEIVVSDGEFTDAETIEIVVQEVNLAPVLEVLDRYSAFEGSELRFTLSAFDADVPTQALTFSAQDLPVGASLDAGSGLFSWTPAEADGPGTWSVSFTVSDGVASDTRTAQIEVLEVNLAPVLAPVGPRTVTEGEELSIQLAASDPDHPAQSLLFSMTTDIP